METEIQHRHTGGVLMAIEGNLRGADLRGANLDFSCFPLWCGSFDMIVDDNIVYQLVGHLFRLNTEYCSPWVKYVLRSDNEINNLKNKLCEKRRNVKPI